MISTGTFIQQEVRLILLWQLLFHCAVRPCVWQYTCSCPSWRIGMTVGTFTHTRVLGRQVLQYLTSAQQ